MSLDRRPEDDSPVDPSSGESPEAASAEIIRRELTATFWAGPLPHPDLLRAYDEIVPGSAKQLIDTFDRQAHHRMELEKAVILGDVSRSNRGLWMAGSGVIAVLVVAAVVILTGHDTAGIVIASVDIGSIVAVFIYGTESRRRERNEKARAVPDPSEVTPPPAG